MRWSNVSVCVAGLSLLIGCGSGAEEPQEWLDWDDGKSDGSGQSVTTQNLNAAMWQGYDPVFDRVTPNRCLQVDEVRLAPTEPRFQIPTLRYVETREELAKELGIDLTLGGRLGIGSAELGFKLLDSMTSTSDSVAFVVRATEDYAVLRRPGGGSIVLDDRGREFLEDDEINAFVSECGTHFVNGVRYGASIDVLLTFRSTEARHVRDLSATVTASAAAAPVELDGSVGRDLDEASEGLELSIAVSAKGFNVSVPDDAVGQLGEECRDVAQTLEGESGSTSDRIDSLLTDLVVNDRDALPRLFTHVDCLKEIMHLSVTAEAERCRADAAECGFGDAAPVEVVLEEYRSARAGDLADKLDAAEAERQRLQRTLATLGAVRARTRAAFYDEIAPFQDAEPGTKAMFTTADSPQSLAALQEIADAWSAKFSPVDGAGDVDTSLSEAIEECGARASNDIFHRCVPEELEDAGELDVVVDAEGALAQYEEQRIMPLQVVVAPEALNYSVPGVDDAMEFCEELGTGYRLPAHDEVAALELLVREGPVPDRTMWVSDDAEDCALSGAYFDPTAEVPIACSSVGQRGTICVAPGGPLPELSKL